MALSAGLRLGPYEIVAPLGAGGMGEVYVARDTRLDRRVAIKVLPSSQSATQEAKARLEREARALSALSHPNICHLYDVGVYEGTTFLVMELLEGESVGDHLKNHGPLLPDQVYRLAIEIADALGKAHRCGILHRDLKPANVVMTESGAKLLDFGLAKPAGATMGAFASMVTVASSVTRAGFIVGTFQYMSPEQLDGKEIDERSDIFSLGALLYEAATGAAPFSGGTTASTIARIMTEVPPPLMSRNAAMPAELDAIIHKCLAKKPDDRYRSADELVLALRMASSSSAVRRGFPVARIAAGKTKWIALTVSALLVAALAVYFWPAAPYRPADDALRWYERGMLAIEDGTYYTAANMFSRAAASDPRFVLAHARLAVASMELDDGVRAREELLLAEAPTRHGIRLSAADQQVQEATYREVTGDYAGALAAYRAIADNAPAEQKSTAEIDVARTLEKMGRAPEALSIYTRITSEQPQYATAWLRKAQLETNKNNYEAAEESVARALALYQSANNLEGVAMAYLAQSTLYGKTGKIAQAKSTDREALRLAQDTSDLQLQVNALVHFGYMSLDESTAECEKYVNQAVELARGAGAEHLVIRGLHQLGNVYFLRGDAAKAESYFSQELTLARSFHSDYAEAAALFSLGSLRITQLKPAEGTASIEEALKYYTRVQRNHEVMLGQILLARGYAENLRFADAVSMLDQAQAAAAKQGDNPTLYSARNYRAWVLRHMGRTPEALSIYRDICLASTTPRDTVSACSGYADVAWQLGDYAEAARRYEQANDAGSRVGMNAALADSHLGRAEMFASQNAFQNAKREAEAALRLAPRPGERVELAIVIGKVEAAAGHKQEAIHQANEALHDSQNLTLRLQVEGALGSAEVALANREYRDALTRAVAVHDQLRKAGLVESVWHAAAVAAIASSFLSDQAEAMRWADAANQEFAEAQSQLGEAAAGYRDRPDIRALRTQLAKLK